MEITFSAYMIKLASTTEDIKPRCRSAMDRELVQIHSIRIFFPDKEILLLDEDASGVLRHAKLHPQVAASRAQSVG